MTPFDVDAARAATPGCHDIAFLNNAGSALPTQRTLDAVIEHLRLEARIGGYLAMAAAEENLARGKDLAANLLGAKGPHEIAFVPSDSAGFNKVFWGLLLGEQIVPGDRILVDCIAYNSHYLAVLQAREQFDLRVDVIPSRSDGSIDLDGLDGALDDDVALVSATMIGTHCGLVNPVAEVGSRCRALGILYLLDACQAVGQLPIDVRAIGCDALTTTGRKWLRAPRGTGLLWVDEDVIPGCTPPGIDGHATDWLDADNYVMADDARRFEEFETSFAAQVGLVSALEQAVELGITPIHQRVTALAEHLRTGLATRPAVQVHDGDGERSGIVTFSLAGDDPATIVEWARAAGVTISSSSAPWARLDMDAKGQTAVVRVSPHYYNTEDELTRLLAVVDDMARGAS